MLRFYFSMFLELERKFSFMDRHFLIFSAAAIESWHHFRDLPVYFLAGAW